MITFRSSQLKTCLRQQWFEIQHSKHPEIYPKAPEHWWLLAGTAKHNMFFEVLSGRDPPNFSQCVESAPDNPVELTPYMRAHLLAEVTEAYPIFKDWLANTSIDIGCPIQEPELVNMIGSVMVSGHPDIVVTDKNIIDFKTGKQFHPDYHYQLSAYRELMKKYDGIQRDCYVVMISKYLKTKKHATPWKEVYLEPKELDKALEWIIKEKPKHIPIIENNELPPAQVGVLCISCPFRGICDGCP